MLGFKLYNRHQPLAFAVNGIALESWTGINASSFWFPCCAVESSFLNGSLDVSAREAFRSTAAESYVSTRLLVSSNLSAAAIDADFVELGSPSRGSHERSINKSSAASNGRFVVRSRSVTAKSNIRFALLMSSELRAVNENCIHMSTHNALMLLAFMCVYLAILQLDICVAASRYMMKYGLNGGVDIMGRDGAFDLRKIHFFLN